MSLPLTRRAFTAQAHAALRSVRRTPLLLFALLPFAVPSVGSAALRATATYTVPDEIVTEYQKQAGVSREHAREHLTLQARAATIVDDLKEALVYAY